MAFTLSSGLEEVSRSFHGDSRGFQEHCSRDLKTLQSQLFNEIEEIVPKASDDFEKLPRTFQETFRSPQTIPKSSPRDQEYDQEASKSAREGAKRLPRAAQIAARTLRVAKTTPRPSQESSEEFLEAI